MENRKLPMHPSHVITEMNHQDRFMYSGREYHPLSYDKSGYRFQSADAQQLELRLSHEQITQALNNGTAEVSYNFHTKHMSKLRWVIGDRMIDDFGHNKVILAFRRERFILEKEKRCRELQRDLTRSELAELLEEFNDKNQPRHIEDAGYNLPAKARCSKAQVSYSTPSTRSLYRWEHEYLSCGRDVRCLIDRHHGPEKTRQVQVCPDSFEIWHEVARGNLSRRKPSKAALLVACKARIHQENKERKDSGRALLIKPTRSSFEAIINNLDEFAVLAGREGPAYARSVYKAKMSGFDVDRPGERVEFDSWTVNLETLLTTAGVWGFLSLKAKEISRTIRIKFNAAIDVATRYVLGLTGTINANSDATVATLEMAMMDKTSLARACGAKTPWFGLRPEAVETDHGSEFKDRARAVMVQAMIALAHPPAGQPFRRPFIESLFRTFGVVLLPYFDGRTFGNVLEKGDYDAEANAALAAEEFMMLFIRGICDVYHHTPHAGLNGNTPHNAMLEKRSTYRLRALPNATERRNLFGVTLTRSITAAGVTVYGIPYNNDTLQQIRRSEGKATVRVRFHPKNLAAVSVQSDRGWFRVDNTIGVDDTVTVGEWLKAARGTVGQNQNSAEPNVGDMFDAINDIRGSADAAAFRENITPHRLSDEEYDRVEKSMFEGRPAYTAMRKSTLVPPEIAAHPLHHGAVGERAPLITTIDTSKAAGFDGLSANRTHDEFGEF